jgi:hypothetical protein
MQLKIKTPRNGYVRCATEMPILAVQLVPIPDNPTRGVLGLLTEDGPLALGVTADSAQEIADLLGRAASVMRKASSC